LANLPQQITGYVEGEGYDPKSLCDISDSFIIMPKHQQMLLFFNAKFYYCPLSALHWPAQAGHNWKSEVHYTAA
jgi:hypothetical protein